MSEHPYPEQSRPTGDDSPSDPYAPWTSRPAGRQDQDVPVYGVPYPTDASTGRPQQALPIHQLPTQGILGQPLPSGHPASPAADDSPVWGARAAGSDDVTTSGDVPAEGKKKISTMAKTLTAVGVAAVVAVGGTVAVTSANAAGTSTTQQGGPGGSGQGGPGGGGFGGGTGGRGGFGGGSTTDGTGSTGGFQGGQGGQTPPGANGSTGGTGGSPSAQPTV